MYQRFTDRACKVMRLANAQAQRFNHLYIGTEHILLGLIEEGSGVAAHVLKNLGVDRTKAAAHVERFVPCGPEMANQNERGHTPLAKKVIAYSMEEAQNLNHNYVGTEHLLLGLLREEQGVAAKALTELGLKLDPVRREVSSLLGGEGLVKQQRISGDESSIRQVFESPRVSFNRQLPDVKGTTQGSIVAVDVGNSGIKLGLFETSTMRSLGANQLPEPTYTLELPIVHETGEFDESSLATWCATNLSPEVRWFVGSVRRNTSERLTNLLSNWTRYQNLDWPVRTLVYQDLPMQVRVDEPARVGIDRLLAANAANRLKAAGSAAIVVDLGTAITVDLVETDGAFAGGAILPGFGTAGSALADRTDALPHIELQDSSAPPAPLGKSTTSAIEAGLYWGAVGAIEKLISQLSQGMLTDPDLFITGGAASAVVKSLDPHVRFVPHLVLAGIALLESDNLGAKKG